MTPKLKNKARFVDFERARDGESESWTRADPSTASEISSVGDATWSIQLPEGDQHLTWLVQLEDDYLGRCDCKGFAFHGAPENQRLDGETPKFAPCAHLCTLRKAAVLDDSLIPDADDVDLSGISIVTDARDVDDSAADADTVAADEEDLDVDVDVVDQTESDVDQEAVDEEQPTETNPTQPTSSTSADVDGSVAAAQLVQQRHAATPDVEAVEDQREFVEEIAGVPSVFVVDMGRGKSSKPYVTKEGLNYIARQAGIETRAEPISPSWEDDADVAAYRGIAIDAEGRRYEDIATAHAGTVENTVGRENLDELASTRATNRALRLATGCGFASIEELTDDQELVDEPAPAQEVADD